MEFRIGWREGLPWLIEETEISFQFLLCLRVFGPVYGLAIHRHAPRGDAARECGQYRLVGRRAARAYVGFLDAKKPLPSVSLWTRIGMFISSEPSLFLTLGILFGYLFYPSVGRSVVPVAGPSLLMTIMFTMGLAISFQDWKRMARRPKLVGISVVLRWACMPFVAFLLSLVLLRLFPGATGKALAVGMIVLGTTPTEEGRTRLLWSPRAISRFRSRSRRSIRCSRLFCSRS